VKVTTTTNKTKQHQATMERLMEIGNEHRVIRLNVGGMLYMTSLKTLKGKILKLVSQAEPDNQGHYCIDRDGPSFRYILNWLRNKSFLPKSMDKETMEILLMEAEFYGLDELAEQLRDITCPTYELLIAQGTPNESVANIEKLITNRVGRGYETVGGTSMAVNVNNSQYLYTFTQLVKTI